VHKVSISPRPRPRDHHDLPIEDALSYDEHYMKNTLAKLMGGRVLRSSSSPAGRAVPATNREGHQPRPQMVTVFGMSDLMGPIAFGRRKSTSSWVRDLPAIGTIRTAAIQDRRRGFDGSSMRRTRPRTHPPGPRDLLHQIAQPSREGDLEGKDIDAIIDRVKPAFIHEDRSPP